MDSLTARLFPFYAEAILIPPDATTFNKHKTANTLFGGSAKDIRSYTYRDGYLDTSVCDLHASSRTLRHRSINSALEYKGPPSYIDQLLVARKRGYTEFDSNPELQAALELRSPCEPLQFLYAERPDLIGFPLTEQAHSDVEVLMREVEDPSRERIEVVLAFHVYTLTVGGITSSENQLLEIQANGTSSSNFFRYRQHFKYMIDLFAASGYLRSPVGKYHRIERSSLDQFLG